MDKKKVTTIVIAVLILAIVGVGIFFATRKSETGESDALKFKREYEALNGEKASGDNVYQTLDISETNKVKYVDLNKTVEFLEKGTGLIYFGFPNCPWCRGMLPTLLDTVESSYLDSISYVDMTNKRDVFEVKDGKAVKTVDASDEYYRILEILDEYLDDYTIKDNSTDKVYKTEEKRMYLPLVVAVKDGRVEHAVTSPVKLEDGQTAFDELTDKQAENLKDMFKDMIKKTETAVCDEHC